MLPAVFVRVLFAVLVLSTLAVIAAVIACVVRVRRHMRTSDTALREALDRIAEQKRSTAETRSGS